MESREWNLFGWRGKRSVGPSSAACDLLGDPELGTPTNSVFCHYLSPASGLVPEQWRGEYRGADITMIMNVRSYCGCWVSV